MFFYTELVYLYLVYIDKNRKIDSVLKIVALRKLEWISIYVKKINKSQYPLSKQQKFARLERKYELFYSVKFDLYLKYIEIL